MGCDRSRCAGETGTTAVEYALVAGLIAVVIAAAVALVAPQLMPWLLEAAAAVA